MWGRGVTKTWGPAGCHKRKRRKLAKANTFSVSGHPMGAAVLCLTLPAKTDQKF